MVSGTHYTASCRQSFKASPIRLPLRLAEMAWRMFDHALVLGVIHAPVWGGSNVRHVGADRDGHSFSRKKAGLKGIQKVMSGFAILRLGASLKSGGADGQTLQVFLHKCCGRFIRLKIIDITCLNIDKT